MPGLSAQRDFQSVPASHVLVQVVRTDDRTYPLRSTSTHRPFDMMGFRKGIFQERSAVANRLGLNRKWIMQMTECRIRKRCKLACANLPCCSDGQLSLRIGLESANHKGMTDEDTRSVWNTSGKDRPHRIIMCLDRFVLMHVPNGRRIRKWHRIKRHPFNRDRVMTGVSFPTRCRPARWSNVVRNLTVRPNRDFR